MSEPEEDFAAMFEASTKAKRFERGQTLEGTIVAIGPAEAFVDVGGKGEATIEIAELKDDDGALEVAVGDVGELAQPMVADVRHPRRGWLDSLGQS